MWKPAVPLIQSSNCCQNDSLQRRAKFNTAHSTSRLQRIVYRAVWLCYVPAGAKLCLESSTFEINFMALDKDPMHATMLKSFAQDVLNSLQNRKWCNGATVHQLGILVPHDDCYFSKALPQFKLRNYAVSSKKLTVVKWGIMPCLAFENAELYHVFCHGQCTVSTLLLIWLHSVFSHYKIHLVNALTERCIKTAIGIMKASWCHKLTNQLSLYVQHPAVSGPRNFRTSRSISITHSSTNLRTRQLWDINMLTTALHSSKQAEKWRQVRETFHKCSQMLVKKNSPMSS